MCGECILAAGELRENHPGLAHSHVFAGRDRLIGPGVYKHLPVGADCGQPGIGLLGSLLGYAVAARLGRRRRPFGQFALATERPIA